jgi:hypothetical protein
MLVFAVDEYQGLGFRHSRYEQIWTTRLCVLPTFPIVFKFRWVSSAEPVARRRHFARGDILN